MNKNVNVKSVQNYMDKVKCPAAGMVYVWANACKAGNGMRCTKCGGTDHSK